MTEVAFIHTGRLEAMMEDGQVLPVTDMFDSHGDDCDDLSEAVSCVVGPDRAGLWVTIDLTAFEGERLQ